MSIKSAMMEEAAEACGLATLRARAGKSGKMVLIEQQFDGERGT